MGSFLISLELQAQCEVANVGTADFTSNQQGAPICEYCPFDLYSPLAHKTPCFFKAHKTHVQVFVFQTIQFFKRHKDIELKDRRDLLYNAASLMITYFNHSRTNCLHVKSR